MRLKDAGISVDRPTNILSGRDSTFMHLHDKNVRGRDMMYGEAQRKAAFARDR